MAFVVKYNGVIIHTMSDGEHITLPTNGKVMAGDIEIEPEAVGGPYLTFSSDAPFSIKYNTTKTWAGTLEGSSDKTTWTAITGSSDVITAAQSGAKYYAYLRGTGNVRITGSGDYHFIITATSGVACNGDIRTLLDYNDPENATIGAYAFALLFKNCDKLTSPPSLPITTLKNYTYSNMFLGCTMLETLPKLPALEVINDSYAGMFNGCTNIKLSTTQDSTYKYPYRIPTEGTGSGDGNLTDMFANTGGTFTGTPTVNTTYYTDHEPV